MVILNLSEHGPVIFKILLIPISGPLDLLSIHPLMI